MKDNTDTRREVAGRAAEDIRAAYQALPQMIAKEGQKQWSATSVFIQFSLAMIAA